VNSIIQSFISARSLMRDASGFKVVDEGQRFYRRDAGIIESSQDQRKDSEPGGMSGQDCIGKSSGENDKHFLQSKGCDGENNMDMNILMDSVKELKEKIENKLTPMQDQIDFLEKAMAGMETRGLNGSEADYAILNKKKNIKPYALKGPNDIKNYDSLFGKSVDWQDKDISFFQAVLSGRHHPGLKIQDSMSEGVPGDGGFAVPSETASMIHSVSLENEIVMPRAFVQPMKSNEISIPAMTIGSHSVSLFGGFRAYYKAELGQLDEANPKTRAMVLEAKKLTGLLQFSNELCEDIPGGEDQIIQICGKGLAWYRDRAFLKGTGAGMPLGILNADCTIEVAKEVGQTRATDPVQYVNLAKMVGSLHPACFLRSVWVVHPTLIPALLQLVIPVGTGGSYIPVLKEDSGQFTIMTRPVLFSEKVESSGNKGDILLADFSQYCVGLRSGMRFDKSIHVAFKTDETTARLIERHDGQPLWDAPLTLEDGTTKVSPFVVLGE
jgi:HK97 family phage major capsid protein